MVNAAPIQIFQLIFKLLRGFARIYEVLRTLRCCTKCTMYFAQKLEKYRKNVRGITHYYAKLRRQRDERLMINYVLCTVFEAYFVLIIFNHMLFSKQLL